MNGAISLRQVFGRWFPPLMPPQLAPLAPEQSVNLLAADERWITVVTLESDLAVAERLGFTTMEPEPRQQVAERLVFYRWLCECGRLSDWGRS